MYYKNFFNGQVLTEQEYLDAIEKRITERLENSGEFEDFLNEQYDTLDIFNFNDYDRIEARREFEEKTRKSVGWAFKQKYRECQGEPTNKRKICIRVRETRKVIRELPDSDFDEEGINSDVLNDILGEFEEVTGIYGEDEDTSTYYEL